MNPICKKPLFNDTDSIYTGGICHKDLFLFLNPDKNEVDIFNCCLKKISCISTEKYQSITDNKEDCTFILTKLDDKDYLYKTTYDFLEFERIKLNIPIKYREKINDIYYDNKSKRIYLATNHFIYTTTSDGYFIKEEASFASSNKNIVIKNLNGCCVPYPQTNKILNKFTAVGKCDNYYMAYIENNENVLSTIENDECSQRICLGKDIEVVSMFVCAKKLLLLVIKNGKYNYLYETDLCCEDCECNCNNYLPCGEPLSCKPVHHHKHCIDPTASVLESIALVETSLSHILNAEGEKIQKAIAEDANICDLLKVNESVTDTIFNATMLEHVLQEKIDRLIKLDKHD